MPLRNRRTVLAVLAGTAVAGCLGDESTDADAAETDLPTTCPTSKDLDVEWPDPLDENAVGSFVVEYEDHYYKTYIAGYEPSSRLDRYEVSVNLDGPPESVDDGFRVSVRGGGGIFTPALVLDADQEDAPDDAEVVSLEAVEAGPLRDALDRAAAGEEVLTSIEEGDEIDRALDVLESLFPDFEPPTDVISDTVYFDDDGTCIRLTVRDDDYHGDDVWYSDYYVDEATVYRLSPPEGSPREDGRLLECRESTRS